MAEGTIAYVLKGYPRRSELFIASEIWRLERHGVPLRLFVIKPSDEASHHPVVDEIATEPVYLPTTTSLSATTLRAWLRTNGPAFGPALRRVARRHPRRLARAVATAAAQSWRARTGRRLRTVYVKELLQAVALADELDRAGDVAHLHAHFAHGTTTVTWLASIIADVSFSFTGHAKDIYRPSLNPAGLLARKLRAASFVATCTGANAEHLRRLAPDAVVQVVYHGLNADFARLVADLEPPAAPPRPRVVSVGRHVEKKGFDVLLRAIATLRDRGVDVELAIGGDHGDRTAEIHRLVDDLGLGADVVDLGPLSQHELLEEYRRSTVFALACRIVGDGDRDGIPNVLVEAMAAGLPVVSTAVSGIPELIRDGDNGRLVEPDDPGALAEALWQVIKDPAMASDLAGAGRATVAADFDGDLLAAQLADLFAPARTRARTRAVTSTPDDRLRDVVCVVDGRHRDMAIAAATRRGAFTHLGRTLQLGRRPSWLDDGLTDDEEWRIEWVKLYEGLDLAHAFGATGDADYVRAWEDLVESFCDQVPVGHDPSDVSARRVLNWVYAWQRFATAPAFSGLRAGLADRLRERIRADLDHLERNLTAARNHRTLELYGLLIGALAMNDRGRAERAVSLLADNAVVDVLVDGVHCERSSDYHCIVLRSLVGAIVNARHAALDVPASLLDRTDLAATVAMHLQRPDGTTPALSDGDQGDYRDLLELAGDALDRDDLRWVATDGRTGHPPAACNVTFPIGGYAIQRSDWSTERPSDDERWAVFDVGPLGDGGHGHYDHLSVEIATGHRRLIVDPGRYTYADGAEGWRRSFKGTAAHNTICVDGLDQTPYRRGKPSGTVSSASLIGRCSIDGLDVVRAQAISPQYRAVHTRALGFVASEYWVIHDVVTDDVDRDCVARWHLDAPAQGGTRVESTGGGTVVRASGLTMLVGGHVADVDVEPGWVSPVYGTKLPAPVIAVHGGRRRQLSLVTVIVPGDRRVAFRSLAATADGAIDVELQVDAWTDRVRWDSQLTALRWVRRPC